MASWWYKTRYEKGWKKMTQVPDQVLTKTTLSLPGNAYEQSYFRRLIGDIQRIFNSIQTPSEGRESSESFSWFIG